MQRTAPVGRGEFSGGAGRPPLMHALGGRRKSPMSQWNPSGRVHLRACLVMLSPCLALACSLSTLRNDESSTDLTRSPCYGAYVSCQSGCGGGGSASDHDCMNRCESMRTGCGEQATASTAASAKVKKCERKQNSCFDACRDVQDLEAK